MGSAIGILCQASEATLKDRARRRPAYKKIHSVRVCDVHEHESTVLFSHETSESLSENLMKIVELHISSKQASARASLNQQRRLPSQALFASLNFNASAEAESVKCNNPFEVESVSETKAKMETASEREKLA